MLDASLPPAGDDSLAVRRTTWTRWIWLPVVAVTLAIGLWFMTHPAPLPTAERTIAAATPTATPVYVGVLAGTVTETRAIRVRRVEVEVTGGRADVKALVCRGGTIGVTAAPEAFCADLEPAEGATLDLGAGDSLILGIAADQGGEVRVDGVLLSYRHGFQWDTQQVGPQLAIEVLTR